MPSYNATAIIIRRLNYSETDKILTLYSRELGRFTAIAKGARKTVSRLSGATELLTCTSFNLATGKTMDVVTQTEVRESFSALRQDLVRLAHGLYFADLVDHSVEDREPNPVLYDLLITGLHLVQAAPSPELVARWFELQLLGDLGYLPNLYQCAVCHEDVTIVTNVENPPKYALSASQGAILCNLHTRTGHYDDHSVLSGDSVNLLRTLEQIPPARCHNIVELSTSDLHSVDQSGMALRRYLRYRLERELKSLTFIDSLRHTQI
jgi:DNA repair protein RecO (recombination protein O)